MASVTRPASHDDDSWRSRRVVSPPRNELNSLRPPLNPGERVVFEFFDTYLPLDWEIYVQPHLNGLRPDFVLLHPKVGIAVFEVKDWNLSAIEYSLDTGTSPPSLFGKQADGRRFRQESPLEKVHLYKTEISRLYCPGLDQLGGIAAVTAGVIMPHASEQQLESLLGPALRYRANTDAAQRYWRLVGRETIRSGNIASALPDVQRSSSKLMCPEIADDLRHWLVEPEFSAQQRRRPYLDSRQRTVVETRTPTGYRRVRGPAGSGKTVALAGRAATLEREGKDVLVVSYNITLINYLRDASVRFGADPRNITWLNFHAWCKRTLMQLGREDDYRALFRGGDEEREAEDAPSKVLDERLPSLVSEALEESGVGGVPIYDAILVDEGQDMLPDWWNTLRRVVKPSPVGEMLLVADRGQDVYSRNSVWTEETLDGAGFKGGSWYELKTSYRMPRQLTDLARTYLETFLPDPDTLMPEPPLQQELEVDICHLTWIQCNVDALAGEVVEAIRQMVVDSRSDAVGSELAFADVVFLCDRLQLGREVLTLLGDRNIRVVDTFAESSRARRRQKQYFFKGSERVKGTTLHSFKGWEGRALVVAVGTGQSVAARHAFYSGLTRLKAHPQGAHLSVICADPALRDFGRMWPTFIGK